MCNMFHSQATGLWSIVGSSCWHRSVPNLPRIQSTQKLEALCRLLHSSYNNSIRSHNQATWAFISTNELAYKHQSTGSTGCELLLKRHHIQMCRWSAHFPFDAKNVFSPLARWQVSEENRFKNMLKCNQGGKCANFSLLKCTH